jgi:hypothetical protein
MESCLARIDANVSPRLRAAAIIYQLLMIVPMWDNVLTDACRPRKFAFFVVGCVLLKFALSFKTYSHY